MKQLMSVTYGGDWQLVALQAHFQFGIGLGLVITQEVMSKNYDDDSPRYQCLSFSFWFMGLVIIATVPMYVVAKDKDFLLEDEKGEL